MVQVLGEIAPLESAKRVSEFIVFSLGFNQLSLLAIFEEAAERRGTASWLTGPLKALLEND
jgi:hypothetical protein